MTGNSDFPPPGVTAARMSAMSAASPAASASTIAATCAWCRRRERGGEDSRDAPKLLKHHLNRYGSEGNPLFYSG
jgi:cytochrome c553